MEGLQSGSWSVIDLARGGTNGWIGRCFRLNIRGQAMAMKLLAVRRQVTLGPLEQGVHGRGEGN